jgi:hypothetical protein
MNCIGFFGKHHSKVAAYLLVTFSFIVSAADIDYWAQNFTTSKRYQQHIRRSFNMGWHFYKGNPSGYPSPADKGYNDDSWQKVNVPHSVSYDAPDTKAFYQGVAWYRKKFTLPDTSTNKKVIIEFEGAMSTAEVWVNGSRVGIHETSGYTGFLFDITDKVIRNDSNVIAVKVDNSWQADVPPGNGTIDYITLGGIYRDVWLHLSDKTYIPQWGQIISTPVVSASSATVNVNTTVTNDKPQASSCSVTYKILNSNNTQVSTQTAQQNIPANGMYVFNMSSSISSPALWSPDSPSLYKIVTTVSVDGVPVDDYSDRFGVRTIVFSKDSGLILNGKRLEVSGINLHQEFGWVQAAVPTSRFYKTVEFIKDAGFNTMRCSHYPRDPSFYDACDELGLMLFVESPSWGWSHSSYSDLFWTRLLGAYKEMVIQGNNHPSIITYGYFNEPFADFGSYMSKMKQICDSINPTIKKYCGVNPNGVDKPGNLMYDDVLGYQYYSPSQVPAPYNNIPVVCTEYLAMENTRGDAAAEAKIADTAWKAFLTIRKDGPRSAGGILWCLKDYYGAMFGTSNQHLGLVDFCFVPKQGYYTFRKNLTGKADDNPISGTASKVSLEPDLTYLRADGTDISRIIVAIRDNNGKCINSSASVNLSVSGSSCTLFGPTTVNMVSGKFGIVVKSTETVGPTTITASSNGLAGSNVTITTYPAVDIATPVHTPLISKTAACNRTMVKKIISLSGKDFARIPVSKDESIQVFDLTGHLVASVRPDNKGTLPRFSNGIHVIKIQKNGKK